MCGGAWISIILPVNAREQLNTKFLCSVVDAPFEAQRE